MVRLGELMMILELHRQGLSVTAIARRTGRDPLLEPLIGDTVETTAIVSQWQELMRLKASIQAGTVLHSIILRKLAAAGPGNALSRALRALGRIERTLFALQWLSDPDLRQRSHAGLNKGEAGNSLRRAVFFHRQGEYPRSYLREPELPGIRREPDHRRHCPLEYGVSRSRCSAPAHPGRPCARCSPRPCRAPRLGTLCPHRRLRLD